MSENYFYLNRNQPNRVLYFKEWLPSIYLPSVKILRRNNVNVAETQYRQEIQDAITTCGEVHSNSKQKLETILTQFNSMSKRAKIENGCSDTIMLAYTEVIRHLERLDLASIRPEAPLASGVIDLSGIFMGPIAFPHGEMTVETRRILMTVFDLLEGLPLLTEDEYSENAYVIHAVSKVLDPILKCSKWPLKRAWMERMEATNSGKKPDLQVLLKLDMVESELVLAEVSRLLPQQNDTTDTARSLNIELGKVPVLGIQVIRDRVAVSALDLLKMIFIEFFRSNALKLRSVVEKIIAMAVGVKDEINLLPVIEDRTPSSSMMSTTYSPPRSCYVIRINLLEYHISIPEKFPQLYKVLLYKKKDITAIQKKLGINSNINQTAVSESKKAKKLVDSYELLLELVGDLILIQGNLGIDINPILEAELRRDKASSDKPIRLFDLLLCLEDDIATIQEKLGIVGYTNQEMGNY
ncbi:4753_t:CDS:2 [Entrophospora sp. SA101]|nr:4753_t:CDS:2 [Entrophospora sp. SA101]